MEDIQTEDLHFSETIKTSLAYTTVWANFLAIVGFIHAVQDISAAHPELTIKQINNAHYK